MRPGLGSANVMVNLENGWNLTSLNQDVDSQVDELLTSAGSFIGSVAGAIPPNAPLQNPQSGMTMERTEQQWVVSATNIPLGYYESVIGCSGSGAKQMHGWRYVGFMPFNGCPTCVQGSDSVSCHENVLFGLVFEKGVMTFKEIGLVNIGNETQKELTPTGTVVRTTTTNFGANPAPENNSGDGPNDGSQNPSEIPVIPGGSDTRDSQSSNSSSRRTW